LFCFSRLGTLLPTTPAARALTRRPTPRHVPRAQLANTIPTLLSQTATAAPAANTKTRLLRRAAKGAQVATTARRALRATMHALAGKQPNMLFG